MGPPRFSGGKTIPARLSRGHVESFNGAAAFQRRKVRQSPGPGRPTWSFNGAAAFQRRKEARSDPQTRRPPVASMGPPRFSGGKPHMVGILDKATFRLQWGRRVSAAESRSTRARSVWAPTRFNGAAAFQRRKDGPRQRHTRASIGLQWGRRVSAAESGQRLHRHLQPGPGFNGAAAFQRRKAAEGRDAVTVLRSASMGPPRFSGGTMVCVDCMRSCFQASMGPPRFSGGKARPKAVAASTTSMLQWGRRVSAAESPLTTPRVSKGSSRFNGAAAFQRRKVADPLPLV